MSRHLAAMIVDQVLEKIEDRALIEWVEQEDFDVNRDELVRMVEKLLEMDRMGR